MRISESDNLKSIANDIETIGKFNDLHFLYGDDLSRLYGVDKSNLKFGKMFFYGECTMTSGNRRVRRRKRIEIEFLTERHNTYATHAMDRLLTWYDYCKGNPTTEKSVNIIYCAARYYTLWLENTQQLENVDEFRIYDVKIQEEELCG